MWCTFKSCTFLQRFGLEFQKLSLSLPLFENILWNRLNKRKKFLVLSTHEKPEENKVACQNSTGIAYMCVHVCVWPVFAESDSTWERMCVRASILDRNFAAFSLNRPIWRKNCDTWGESDTSRWKVGVALYTGNSQSIWTTEITLLLISAMLICLVYSNIGHM